MTDNSSPQWNSGISYIQRLDNLTRGYEELVVAGQYTEAMTALWCLNDEVSAWLKTKPKKHKDTLDALNAKRNAAANTQGKPALKFLSNWNAEIQTAIHQNGLGMPTKARNMGGGDV